MRAFGCITGRLTVKTLISIYSMLMLLVVLGSNTEGFTALSTAGVRQHSFSRRVHNKLYGKSRINRAGPNKDHCEDTIVPLIDDGDSTGDFATSNMSLEELLLPSLKCDVNQVGPTALAYIGDVVFELMVRARHIWPTRRTSDLQRQVVALVRGMLFLIF